MSISTRFLTRKEKQLLSAIFITESGIRRNDYPKLCHTLTSLGIKTTNMDDGDMRVLVDTACSLVVSARPVIGGRRARGAADQRTQQQLPPSHQHQAANINNRRKSNSPLRKARNQQREELKESIKNSMQHALSSSASPPSAGAEAAATRESPPRHRPSQHNPRGASQSRKRTPNAKAYSAERRLEFPEGAENNKGNTRNKSPQKGPHLNNNTSPFSDPLVVPSAAAGTAAAGPNPLEASMTNSERERLEEIAAREREEKLRKEEEEREEAAAAAELRRHEQLLGPPNRMLLLQEFLLFVDLLKSRYVDLVSAADADVLEAFMSVGGKEDTSGDVSADLLKSRLKDINLSVDIDRLIEEVDEDGSGKIEYVEFFSLMTNSKMSACVVPPDSALLSEDNAAIAAAAEAASLKGKQLPSASPMKQIMGGKGGKPEGGSRRESQNSAQPFAREHDGDNDDGEEDDDGDASPPIDEGPEMLDPFCLFKRLGGDPDDEDCAVLTRHHILAKLPNIGLSNDELRTYMYFAEKSQTEHFTLQTLTDLVSYADMGFRAYESPEAQAARLRALRGEDGDDGDDASRGRRKMEGLSKILAGVGKDNRRSNAAVAVDDSSTPKNREDPAGNNNNTNTATADASEGAGEEDRSALASALATLEGCLTDRIPQSILATLVSGPAHTHYMTHKGCTLPPALFHCLELDAAHLTWFVNTFKHRQSQNMTSPTADRFTRAVEALLQELFKHRGGCAACFDDVAKAAKGPSVTERLLKDASLRKGTSRTYDSISPNRRRGGGGGSVADGSSLSSTLPATSANYQPFTIPVPSMVNTRSWTAGTRGIDERHRRQDVFLVGKIAVPPVIGSDEGGGGGGGVSISSSSPRRASPSSAATPNARAKGLAAGDGAVPHPPSSPAGDRSATRSAAKAAALPQLLASPSPRPPSHPQQGGSALTSPSRHSIPHSPSSPPAATARASGRRAMQQSAAAESMASASSPSATRVVALAIPQRVASLYPDVVADESLQGVYVASISGAPNPRLARVSPRYMPVPDCNAIALRVFQKGRGADHLHSHAASQPLASSPPSSSAYNYYRGPPSHQQHHFADSETRSSTTMSAKRKGAEATIIVKHPKQWRPSGSNLSPPRPKPEEERGTGTSEEGPDVSTKTAHSARGVGAANSHPAAKVSGQTRFPSISAR